LAEFSCLFVPRRVRPAVTVAATAVHSSNVRNPVLAQGSSSVEISAESNAVITVKAFSVAATRVRSPAPHQ
jgi:hypothetical protein